MKTNTRNRVEVVNSKIRTEKTVAMAFRDFYVILHQRQGQALMNALRVCATDLYEIVSGTKFDCFYDDKVMPLTLQELGYDFSFFV